MTATTSQNTRYSGVQAHAQYSDPDERRAIVYEHNQEYHEFGFGVRHSIIKFDASAEGVSV